MKASHVVTNILIGQLHNHPKNVRTAYNDLDELAMSIEAQGILQNLTVVPEPGHEDDLDSFYVLIGNRRLQAARKTSLEYLPCVIAYDLTEAEQVAIMMNENMQRKDLTPIEEAQGFQYMLDLGETEDSISLKTGVSKTTVRRRLELNKLDHDLVVKRTTGGMDDYFQLTLTDLDRLSKVKDIDARNDILKKAKGSENLKYLVNENVTVTARKEYFARVVEKLKELGVPKGTKAQEERRYSSGYETVANFSAYDADRNTPIKISTRNKDEWFYCIGYGYGYNSKDIQSINVYAKKGKEDKKSKQQTEAEKREKDRKALMKIARGFAEKRNKFFRQIAAGEYTCARDFDLVSATWMSLFAAGSWVGISTVMHPFELTGDQVTELGMGIQMLGCLIETSKESGYCIGYGTEYKKKEGKTLQNLYGILQKFGFSTDDEDELQMMNGTHPLYHEAR